MKRIALFLFLLIGTTSFAQDRVWIGPTVVELGDSISQQDIFKSILHWVPTYFEDAREVIEFQDPTTGVIMGNGSSQNYFLGIFGEKHPAGWWKFDFKIEARDGRYRYQVFNVRMEHTSRVLVIGEDELMGYDKNRAEELHESLTEGFNNIPLLEEEVW